MGFFRILWGRGDPQPVPGGISREEFERTKRQYDLKLRELDEAMQALRGIEPDSQQPLDGRHAHGA